MTSKELLLAAAIRIEQGVDLFACCAMKEVSGYYDSDTKFNQHCDSYYEAMSKFAFLYKPADVFACDPWFGDGQNEANKLKRIEALRTTAATFN